MKQQSGLKLTIIAVACGIAAAILTVYYLKQVEEKYKRESKPVQQELVAVVVPNTNINKGSVLTAKLIASRKVPMEFLPSNVVMAKDFKKIINRTLLMPLERGKPMTWEAVTGKSAKTYSETIELGRRSKSVKVTKVDSADGLLRPGDKIDLMGYFNGSSVGLASNSSKAKSSDKIIMPILENVEVLAAGKEDMYGRKYEYNTNKNSVDGFNMDFTIVSLNLTPTQVARVEIAEGLGEMFAVLRNPEDTSKAGFEYKEVNLLFEKDEPENIDLVIGEDGKVVGKIIGDKIVDENGNIVGKIVNGKAVSLDGKALGKIVKDVAPDDPLLSVAEIVDVVRDANGKIIGKVVDGKIIDEDGNIIGEVKNGVAVDSNGKVLGTIDKGVAFDIHGNEVDLASSKAAKASEIEQVVRDADGNVIGKIVDGKVVDENGKVIGVVKDGKVIDAHGNVVADNVSVAAELRNADVVVRDADGNVIGKLVDGKVVDENGKIIGTVKDGKVVDADGNVIAENVSVAAEMPDADVVVRDADGNVIGKLVDGKVVDNNGKVIGVVKDGKVIDADGNIIAKNVSVAAEQANASVVVRDANGKVIGKLVDGKVVDANGKVIGKIKDGRVIDADGNVIAENVTFKAEITSDSLLSPDSINTKNLRQVKFVDVILGGTGKDGIIPVQKVRKE